MKGQVYKIHSDFYYIKTASGLIETKLKEVLKKRAETVFVGDFVEVELSDNATQGVISKLCERKNFITHPKAANIDQVIIVSAMAQPELNFEQLDRYIAFCEYYKLVPVLCFNKNDLNNDKDLIDKINSLYVTLGYRIVFISATEKDGIDELENILSEKSSVLCGLSGVGKTSIINTLLTDKILKVGKVCAKTQRGTHTTRHCEMLNIKLSSDRMCRIIDTPGFSNLKFDFILPENISDLFAEIKILKTQCKFNNCLHIDERDCNVITNLDKIAKTRYDSYLKFVEEAKEYKKAYLNKSKKIELKSKFVNNDTKTKISSKKREHTRRRLKQSFENIKGVTE